MTDSTDGRFPNEYTFVSPSHRGYPIFPSDYVVRNGTMTRAEFMEAEARRLS